MSAFPNGLPIKHLGPEAQKLARWRDGSPIAPRGKDGATRGDGLLSKSELTVALDHLADLSPAEQAATKALAASLGVASAPPKKMVWQNRAEAAQGELTGPRESASFGRFAFVRDQRGGINRYDAKYDSWETISDDAPGSRITRFGDELAIVGNRGMALRDPQTGTTKSLVGPGVGSYPATAEVDGALYAVGYRKGPPKQGQAKVFDASSGSWQSIPDLPEPRSSASAIGFEGKLYVIGGREKNRQGSIGSNRIDIYDPAAGQWESPVFMHTARSKASAWIMNGELHIGGGHQRTDDRGFGYTNASVEVLQPDRTLRDGRPLPIGQAWDASAMVVDGRLFVTAFGGEPEPSGDSGMWMKELAEVEPETPQTVVSVRTTNRTVNNNTVNLTVNDNSTHIHTNIHLDVTAFQIDGRPLKAMPYLRTGRLQGHFSGDASLYVCSRRGDSSTLQVVADGSRRLLRGASAGGKGALPAASDRPFLFAPATGARTPITPRSDGSFETALPPAGDGPVLVVQTGPDGAQYAVALDLV